jgi:hypothetical protein
MLHIFEPIYQIRNTWETEEDTEEYCPGAVQENINAKSVNTSKQGRDLLRLVPTKIFRSCHLPKLAQRTVYRSWELLQRRKWGRSCKG